MPQKLFIFLFLLIAASIGFAQNATDKKKAEVFELKGKKYAPKKDNIFTLTSKCLIEFDIKSLW